MLVQEVRNSDHDLWRKAGTAVRVGVGLLASLDAFETVSQYYYLSRDMDYLAYVGSLLGSVRGPGNAPQVLASSRDSVMHDLAPSYERSQGLDQGHPLLVDTGFHGNVLRILLQRWPNARGRLLEAHCSDFPSSRVALRLAGLVTERPFDRRRWVVESIEDAPHEFGKAKDYLESAGRVAPVREPEKEEAAAEFRELVRAEFTAAAAQQLYVDLVACLRPLADWLRHPGGRTVIEFQPDSFASETTSPASLLWAGMVMALRDLCLDIGWRGRSATTSVRVRSEDHTEGWQVEVARIAKQTGVAIVAARDFPQRRADRIIDASVSPNPQGAVGATVQRLDQSSWQLSGQNLEESVLALRSMGLLSAGIADLIDTMRLRPAGWDLSRLNPLLGFLSG
ncbi:hypothetical protein ILP97_02495 [Amycolatopsis sp. H6(2020)]|nr:hypothetical protein [Amycolatopsis sp. H6(2020)]